MQNQDEQNEGASPRVTRSKDDSAFHYNEDTSKWRKKAWTQEEDEFLIKLVHKYGPQKWTVIAENMPGRIGKQCRQRWHNHLNPDINKEEWSSIQEWLLFILHKNLGNQWANFTKYLKGRTDNSIKNHWNSAMKKKLAQFTYKKVKTKLQSNKKTVKELDKFIIDKLAADQMIPELEQEDEAVEEKEKIQPDNILKSTATIVQRKEEEKKTAANEEKTIKKSHKEKDIQATRQDTVTKSKRQSSGQFNPHFATRLSQLSIFGAPSRDNIVSAFSLLDEPQPVVLEPRPSFNDISLSINCIEDLEGEGEANSKINYAEGSILGDLGSLRMVSRASLRQQSQNSFQDNI